ncbi:uncharacterized protein METZ01_LOCUS375914, partial [marine metagenome]
RHRPSRRDGWCRRGRPSHKGGWRRGM